MFLLDTSVLFAGLYQTHVSHIAVSRWLQDVPRFATCGLTQVGVIRLFLTDAAMHGSPLDPNEAHQVLCELISDSRHIFVPCPSVEPAFVGQTKGAKAAFDDYLVQIAHAAQLKLATLDVALTRRWPDYATLIDSAK